MKSLVGLFPSLKRRHVKIALKHFFISFVLLSPIIFCFFLFFKNEIIFHKFGFVIGGRVLVCMICKFFSISGGLAWAILFFVDLFIGFTMGRMVSPAGDAHGGSSSNSQEQQAAANPSGGQPAANPAAEQPSNVPSGALTSVGRGFEERVLLPSSNESSEASVNQQPVIPELEPPLLDDNTRRAELAARLRTNWWGLAYTETILDSFLDKQFQIEKYLEAALVEDGYSRQVLFEKRDEIRGLIFYPGGRALDESTYTRHLTQMETFGTRQSVPYRRILRAVTYSHLFLE